MSKSTRKKTRPTKEEREKKKTEKARIKAELNEQFLKGQKLKEFMFDNVSIECTDCKKLVNIKDDSAIIAGDIYCGDCRDKIITMKLLMGELTLKELEEYQNW